MEATTSETAGPAIAGEDELEATLDLFLDHFLKNHRDDNFLAIKHGTYTVSREDAVGEVVDWTMQYLEWM